MECVYGSPHNRKNGGFKCPQKTKLQLPLSLKIAIFRLFPYNVSMDSTVYNEAFHRNRDCLTRETAVIVSDFLLKNFNICSVCDVGGGIGVWLDVFRSKIDSKSFKGILLEGDYIKKEWLLCPELFQCCNLEENFCLPQKYDLAIALEVAEHLHVNCAERFITNLCKISDLILFSAAIPYQGGAGHLNEQPFSYWRNLFAQNGYSCYDIVRSLISKMDSIPFWYRNNIFVYAKDTLPKNTVMSSCTNDFIDYIHIDTYLKRLSDVQFCSQK